MVIEIVNCKQNFRVSARVRSAEREREMWRRETLGSVGTDGMVVWGGLRDWPGLGRGEEDGEEGREVRREELRSRAVRSREEKSRGEGKNAVRENRGVRRDQWMAKGRSAGVDGGRQKWGMRGEGERSVEGMIGGDGGAAFWRRRQRWRRPVAAATAAAVAGWQHVGN